MDHYLAYYSNATPHEREAPRIYFVENAKHLPVPSGYTCVGPMMRRVVGREVGGFTLSLGLWDPSVAAKANAIVMHTAVLLNHMHVSGRPHEGSPQFLTRRTHLIHLGQGDAMKLTAHQARTGEVLIWPLAMQPRKGMGSGM